MKEDADACGKNPLSGRETERRREEKYKDGPKHLPVFRSLGVPITPLCLLPSKTPDQGGTVWRDL